MDSPSAPPPIDVSGLSNVFSPPRWLRDVGFSSWLMVGVILLVAGLMFLLSMMQTIVLPLITAGIIAAVAGPLVGWLNRKRVPRGIGAMIIMLLIVAFGILVFMLIFGGITSQVSSFGQYFDSAQATVQGWLESMGVDPKQSADATSAASSGSTEAIKSLANGVLQSIGVLTSLVFFTTLTALSMFFLLKDGPQIRAWVERQMSLPTGVARVITSRGIQSLRGYFAGVTAIAIFNATIVGLGAWALGVPEVGTIILVTFFGAYIPYLGAWAAGAFAVLVALGSVGTEAAVAMLVITLLANGLLQQMIQPIAYGAALGIHPLAVLVVTIAGGSLFGGVGLVLAAPVTSAIVRITADFGAAKEAAAEGPTGDSEALPEPAPA